LLLYQVVVVMEIVVVAAVVAVAAVLLLEAENKLNKKIDSKEVCYENQKKYMAITHGDINPRNIFINYIGWLCLNSW
jgi:thiamine kinase-like enzyme